MTNEPLNVLILIADEMRRDAPGCLGGDARTMPALDALAATGTVFPAVNEALTRWKELNAPRKVMRDPTNIPSGV